MRVSGQIMQNMFGAAEGPLGVNHPVLSEKGAEKGVERLLRCQRKARTMEGKLLLRKARLRPATNLPRKTRLKTLTGKKNCGGDEDHGQCAHMDSLSRTDAGGKHFVDVRTL